MSCHFMSHQWRHYGCANGAPHRGPWPEGAHQSPKTINRLHVSSQYNTIIIGKLPLSINGPIINNILLKIMDTLQKIVICGSLDFTQMLSKCRKCHFRDLKFKNVFGGESPRTVYICHHFVGPQIVSRTGAHTHVVPPLCHIMHVISCHVMHVIIL